MRGRVPVGVDSDSRINFVTSNRVTSNNILGASGGEERHQLTVAELASHIHGTEIPSNRAPRYWSPGNGGIGIPQVYGDNTQSTGENRPHNNMQPYLILNYIIKY